MSNIIESLLQRAESHIEDMVDLELQALGMLDRDVDEAKYMQVLSAEDLWVDDLAKAQMTEGERFVSMYR